MKIIALDASTTSTGVAIFDDTEITALFIWSGGEIGRR